MTEDENGSLTPKEQEAKQKIETLIELTDRRFAIWQFFERRADDIKGRLWTTSTWLVALQTGLLAFLMNERLMDLGTAEAWLAPKSPSAVNAGSALGLVFVVLSVTVIDDIARHVRRNWQRASAAKGDYHAVLRSGRIYVLAPLFVVEAALAVAFASLQMISFAESQLRWASVIVWASAVIGVAVYRVLGERPPEVQEGEVATP